MRNNEKYQDVSQQSTKEISKNTQVDEQGLSVHVEPRPLYPYMQAFRSQGRTVIWQVRRDAIRRYWQEKVVQSQANIKCELLNLYLDGATVIAEWQVEFDDLAQNIRKRMREIAVLTFEGTMISSLREYWSSERIGPVRIPQPDPLPRMTASHMQFCFDRY